MERLYCDFCKERISKDNGEARMILAGSYCGPQFVIVATVDKSFTGLELDMTEWGSGERLHSCSSDCTLFLLTYFNLFGVEKFLDVLEKQRVYFEADGVQSNNAFIEANRQDKPDYEKEETNDEDKEDWEKRIEPYELGVKASKGILRQGTSV